jgi:hypothetical protein
MGSGDSWFGFTPVHGFRTTRFAPWSDHVIKTRPGAFPAQDGDADVGCCVQHSRLRSSRSKRDCRSSARFFMHMAVAYTGGCTGHRPAASNSSDQALKLLFPKHRFP